MSRKYKQHRFKLKAPTTTKQGKKEYMKKLMKLRRDKNRKRPYKPRTKKR